MDFLNFAFSSYGIVPRGCKVSGWELDIEEA